MINLLLAIIISLSFNNNVYADIDTTTLEEVQLTDLQLVQNSILDDKDFIEYLDNFGVSESELKDVLESEYFANYVEFELSQSPTQDDIMASWNILDWHIQKIKSFLNYIFTGIKDSFSTQYQDNHRHHRHNYNNMIPPPPPYINGQNSPYYPYNNFNGNLYPNNGMNGNGVQNGGNLGGIYQTAQCNCNCDNCVNCLNK